MSLAPGTISIEFTQNTGFTRTRIKLHDAYLEYTISKLSSRTGFNVPYAQLPTPFYYRTYRTIHGVHGLMAALVVAFLGLAPVLGQVQNLSVVFCFVAVPLMGVGAAISIMRVWKTEFTALSTRPGTILILNDRLRDTILEALRKKRHAVLRGMAVVDATQSSWSELKKFKWLRDQEAISDSEFAKLCDSVSSDPIGTAANPNLTDPHSFH